MAIKNFVSPFGVAVYPKLDKPYTYNAATKRSEPDPENGKFELKLRLTPEQAAPLITEIKEYAKSEGLDLDEVKNWPFKDEKDKATKKKTGFVIVKFGNKAKAKTGLPNRIKHVDARGNVLPSGFKLTSGSVVRASGFMMAFEQLDGGVSLRISQVQIKKLADAGDGPTLEAIEDEDAFEYDGSPVAEENNKNVETEQAPNDGEENFDF